MLLKILVAEDHPQFRRLVCSLLDRGAGLRIAEAADGASAVRTAEAFRPDLVLLDINLPTLDGFEVARRIRGLVPHARILFVTQESAPDFVRTALRLGALGYVDKLRAATDLLPAIDAVMAGERFVSSSVALDQPVQASAPRRHEVLFCPDEAATVDAFAHFVAPALRAGDPAVVVITESHSRQLVLRLRAEGVDIDGALARGTYLWLDSDEAIGVEQFLHALSRVQKAAARAGRTARRVAMCGERAGRLWAEGRMDEALQLEEAAAELPAGVDVLCTYPVPHDRDDEGLKRVCAKHTAVARGR